MPSFRTIDFFTYCFTNRKNGLQLRSKWVQVKWDWNYLIFTRFKLSVNWTYFLVSLNHYRSLSHFLHHHYDVPTEKILIVWTSMSMIFSFRVALLIKLKLINTFYLEKNILFGWSDVIFGNTYKQKEGCTNHP